MSATHTAKLQEMLARWDELQKTEVTIEESGLCPQHVGINQGNADIRGGGPLPAGGFRYVIHAASEIVAPAVLLK